MFSKIIKGIVGQFGLISCETESKNHQDYKEDVKIEIKFEEEVNQQVPQGKLQLLKRKVE